MKTYTRLHMFETNSSSMNQLYIHDFYDYYHYQPSGFSATIRTLDGIAADMAVNDADHICDIPKFIELDTEYARMHNMDDALASYNTTFDKIQYMWALICEMLSDQGGDLFLECIEAANKFITVLKTYIPVVHVKSNQVNYDDFDYAGLSGYQCICSWFTRANLADIAMLLFDTKSTITVGEDNSWPGVCIKDGERIHTIGYTDEQITCGYDVLF